MNIVFPESKKEDEFATTEINKEITNEQQNDSITELKNSMEEDIESSLKLIKGVGNVKVTIAIDTSIEKVYEKEVNDNKTLTEETDSEGGIRKIDQSNITNKATVVSSSSGYEEPLIIKEISPTINGIVVIAEGTSNDRK